MVAAARRFKTHTTSLAELTTMALIHEHEQPNLSKHACILTLIWLLQADFRTPFSLGDPPHRHRCAVQSLCGFLAEPTEMIYQHEQYHAHKKRPHTSTMAQGLSWERDTIISKDNTLPVGQLCKTPLLPTVLRVRRILYFGGNAGYAIPSDTLSNSVRSQSQSLSCI
jgi:hypothetical protein